MILNFPEMEEIVVTPQNGGGKSARVKKFEDPLTRIVLGRMEPGLAFDFHRHDGTCEVVYILEGSGKVILENGEERVAAGMSHYCPKGEAHSLMNDGDKELVFFAVVPHQ